MIVTEIEGIHGSNPGKLIYSTFLGGGGEDRGLVRTHRVCVCVSVSVCVCFVCVFE